MARTYKEVEYTTTKLVQDSLTCDWCGKEFLDDVGYYNTRDFTLEFTFGSQFPESGDAEGWQVEDLCDECVESLRESLIDLGLKVTEVKRSW